MAVLFRRLVECIIRFSILSVSAGLHQWLLRCPDISGALCDLFNYRIDTMLPIIDRYILLEATKVFLGIIFILVIGLVGSGFIKLLGKAAAGLLSNEVLLELVAIETLRLLGPVTPPAFFLSAMVTLGRMYRDSEMTALAASGVGGLRIYRSVIVAALPVMLVVGWLTLDIQPSANQMKREIIAQQGKQAEFSNAVAGRFNEFSRGELVVYVESMSDDKSRLENVFVQNRQHGKLGLVTANQGYQYVDPETGEQFIVLTEGHRWEGIPGRNDFTLGEFGKFTMRIDLKGQSQRHFRADEFPTSKLIGSTEIREKAELEYRIMIPIAVLVFTIISVPLSYSLPREGVAGRLVIALLLYLTFINLMGVSKNWMVDGLTPEWAGRWWVHIFMLFLAGTIVLFRHPGLKRWFRRRWGGVP